ncbi:MAG: M23 family metallopeptidase [Weeksellaceae bacterium]
MRIFNLLFTLLAIGVYAQSYPKDFRNPLDIPNYLAGNFAELRGFHFHAGIDIKTQQREGLKVYAVQDGYVSRINVSPRGYGNAVYITHPNGYTTLYAHLQTYMGAVEKAARSEQYKQKSFAIDYYLPEGAVKVKKGEVIGLSGNSGSSGGPHLHFEVRDSKTEEIINPFLFGYDIPDTKAPLLNGMYIYALNGDVAGKQRYDLTGSKHFNIPVLASGKVGIGVKAYDQHNGAANMNGVYNIQIFADADKIFEYTANKFSFDETRYINCQTDYKQFMANKSWIYQGYMVPGNKLQMVSNLKNDGVIDLEEGRTYEIQVVLMDYAGNKTTGSFKIKGKAKPIDETIQKGKNYIYWNKENYIQTNEVEMWFPKQSFYEDFNLDYTYQNGSYFIHHDDVPLHKFYTLAITPKDIPTHQLDKAVIAVKYKYGGRLAKDYFPTTYKNGKLIAEVRDFGEFVTEIDIQKPTLQSINVKNGAVFSGQNALMKFKVKDTQSGIEKHDAYIDGKWILSMYDKKYSLLTIDLEKENIAKGNHTLELKVTDGKNNTTTYKASFKKAN